MHLNWNLPFIKLPIDRNILAWPFICIFTIISGCHQNHLISSEQYRNYTDSVFKSRVLLCDQKKSELFAVLDKNLTEDQTEALKFLFAYSPLNDLAEFDGEFFLANADIALRARNEFPWGKDIPENIFLHYVLPFRVNNENIDSFRISYYDEIKSRINGLNAREAALEINHWCHEKVTYQPSDIRTSGPVSTILSARGRCGEESTFTVAALRAAGLPARQVYTPRWAHTDDNHAWVEVWVDGKWYCMGACEPEPVLDRGWFVDPAKRAMLIHTKSFGHYTGDENAMVVNEFFSDINNLSKYAPTKMIWVKVLDNQSKPVPGASVEYQLYNYAEFYPLAIIPTDSTGICNFETGLGDLMIWARKESMFGFTKLSVNELDTIVIKVDANHKGSSNYNYDLSVPVPGKPSPVPDPEKMAENSKRVNEENNARQKYIDSWIKPVEAESLAKRNGLDVKIVKDIIARSMGNYKNISLFIESTPSDRKFLSMSLLMQLSDKDLRDTPLRVLVDHISGFSPSDLKTSEYSNEFYNKYVLNPRIANEILTPYREFIINKLPGELKSERRVDPLEIVQYLRSEIRIYDDENYYNTPVSPVGVMKLKISDSFSRKILFVAICRTLKIPSRLEPATLEPQYFAAGRWIDVTFDGKTVREADKGFVSFISDEINPVPEYYIHFTLAKFENGRYNTLEFDYNKKVTDFRDELSLDAGRYMLITGNRVSDSRILVSQEFFELKKDEHRKIRIELRKEAKGIAVTGSVNLDAVLPVNNGSIKLSSLASDGIVIVWIKPEGEPSKHIMNDLKLFKTEFDKWGGNFIFLGENIQGDNSISSEQITGLPEKSIFTVDKGLELLKMTLTNCNPAELQFPYLLVINRRGDIIYRSEGYRIGAGEQILKVVR